MATIESKYTTANAITITLNSLANATFATSSAIDNSTNLFVAADIQVQIKTGASSVSSTGTIEVHLLRSSDGGTTYDSAVQGNPATLIGTFNANANATTYGPYTYPTDIFGQLPDHFKIAVYNNTGAALDSTAGNFFSKFLGKLFQTV
jgi:hypothetical protein